MGRNSSIWKKTNTDTGRIWKLHEALSPTQESNPGSLLQWGEKYSSSMLPHFYTKTKWGTLFFGSYNDFFSRLQTHWSSSVLEYRLVVSLQPYVIHLTLGFKRPERIYQDFPTLDLFQMLHYSRKKRLCHKHLWMRSVIDEVVMEFKVPLLDINFHNHRVLEPSGQQ